MNCMLRPLIVALFAVGCWGCSDDGSESDPGQTSGTEDAGVSSDTATSAEDTRVAEEVGVDSEVLDTAVGEDVPVEEDYCQLQGLSKLGFESGDGGLAFGDTAGDFTVNTLDGTWTLSEQWTGCESYVFLHYIQDLRGNPQGVWDGDSLWGSDVGELLTEGPKNVHYFFVSFEEEEVARSARMMALQGRLDEALQGLESDELREQWGTRLHLVTDRSTEVDGSVGEWTRDYLDYMFSEDSLVDLGDRGQAQAPLPFVFAIDRLQQWDPGGSLDEFVGGEPKFGMAAYLGHFFNHRAGVRDQVAEEEGSTEVVTLLEGSMSDRVFTKEGVLPDAAQMATFDTLEIDVSVTCPYRNPFACSEWDRIANISLCLDSECAERWEIVRWITPYWRRGSRRWLMDASPFLGLMQEGGAHTFRIEMGPDWERKTERDVRVDLRFSQRGEGKMKSRGVERVFTGGEFNADYNDAHPDYRFELPEEATHAELVVILSGHGQAGGNNCAEWCDHRHTFTISGLAVADIAHEGQIGSGRGCALAAAGGASPGQWGNWAPERAYWCPGLPVDAMRFDITGRARTDRRNRLLYSGDFAGNAPNGGSIAMSAYVVWYVD